MNPIDNMNTDATTAQYTPGPWHVAENHRAGNINHLAILAKNNLTMPCSVTPIHLRRAEDDANAALIASAPDLLRERNHLLEVNRRLVKSLTKLAEWAQIPDNGSKDAVILRNEVSAALAFAKGQP